MINERSTRKEVFKANDGTTRCLKCKEVVERRIYVGNRLYTVGCACECDRSENRQRLLAEFKADIEKKRSICFGSHSKYKNSNLTECEVSEIVLKVSNNFCKNFKEIKKQGKGLMFYGSTGTGKTYLASGIANQLIAQGFDVLITNTTRIVNQIQGSFEGKNSILDSLNRYDLLIIDDFGTERKSEYMQEMMYNIIDSRYQTGKPLMITTNLSLETFLNTKELADKRIYERILEMCVPIKVDGINLRKNKLNEGYIRAREFLGV